MSYVSRKDFQLYEALMRLLIEENRQLRQHAETLGIDAERLSAAVRDARQVEADQTGTSRRNSSH